MCEEAEPDPSGEGDSDCGDHKTASDCGSGCAWNCGDSSESSIKINVMQIVIVVVILILLCCLGAAAFLFWPVVIGLLVAAGCVKAMQSTNNAAEATVAHPTKDTEMA